MWKYIPSEGRTLKEPGISADVKEPGISADVMEPGNAEFRLIFFYS